MAATAASLTLLSLTPLSGGQPRPEAPTQEALSEPPWRQGDVAVSVPTDVAPETSDAVNQNLAASEPELAAAQTALAEWAISRFELAGLTLPSIEISFSADTADCAGEQGLYRRRGEDHFVTVCAPSNSGAATEHRRRRTILHEFAHAWDHSHLSGPERREVLSLLDADDWYEGNEWGERGVERLAETLVFGLLDQTRRPLLIEIDCDETYRNFRAITGVAPLGSVRSTCVA